MEDYEARRNRGLESIKVLSGAENPAALADNIIADNGALGSYALDFVMGDVWARKELSGRDRSIVVLSILATLHQTNQLLFYTQGALNYGLSPEEIREVMTHLSLYAGFPRALDAMAAVNNVLAKAAGASDGKQASDGKEASSGKEALPPAEQFTDEQRMTSGAAVLARLSGADATDPQELLASMVGRLGPIADIGLKHGFGDAWARPQLSRRDRSLVTVSILTALGRGAELEIHIPGAIRHGVTKTELEELMLTAMAYAGAPLAVEAMQIVNQQ